jgi:hypothetical protein
MSIAEIYPQLALWATDMTPANAGSGKGKLFVVQFPNVESELDLDVVLF